MRLAAEKSKVRFWMYSVAALMVAALCLGSAQPTFGKSKLKRPRCNRWFTTDFRLEACTFSTTGSNEYFILEPGYQLILEGEEDDTLIELVITVLDETMMVGDVETRIVEEMEMEDGELVEISRNYFAICTETNSVFYFGEDVDNYEDGKIVDHEGGWLAFEDGAEPGLIMPGIILVGARYFQEMAPDVAMDRAQIVAMDAELETPAGMFENCLVTYETTPLERSSRDFKVYAPGVGLIKDEAAELISAGYVAP